MVRMRARAIMRALVIVKGVRGCVVVLTSLSARRQWQWQGVVIVGKWVKVEMCHHQRKGKGEGEGKGTLLLLEKE